LLTNVTVQLELPSQLDRTDAPGIGRQQVITVRLAQTTLSHHVTSGASGSLALVFALVIEQFHQFKGFRTLSRQDDQDHFLEPLIPPMSLVAGLAGVPVAVPLATN
jgi:hypothetical protein